MNKMLVDFAVKASMAAVLGLTPKVTNTPHPSYINACFIVTTIFFKAQLVPLISLQHYEK